MRRLRHWGRFSGPDVPFGVASMLGDPDVVRVCSVEHVAGPGPEPSLFACETHPRAGLKCSSCWGRHVELRHGVGMASSASRAQLWHVPVAGREDAPSVLVSSAALVVVSFR